jgi:peptidoglycan/LPS O-acetylase OafA/YrhL
MNTVSTKKSTLGHIPALDGLRAVAVILVMLTHANFQLGKNGILGVDIFFTLSGFLITTLLLEEYDKFDKISLKAFYVRRSLRLFPALYIMLAAALLYSCLLSGAVQKTIQLEILSSALYLNNISWLWGWGDEGLLLGHTWSLAVEEQFYLIWPLVLILALKFRAMPLLTFAVLCFIGWISFFKLSGNISLINMSLFRETIFIGCLAAILRWTGRLNFNITEYVVLLLLVVVIAFGVFPFKWFATFQLAVARSLVGVIAAIVIIAVVNKPSGIAGKLMGFSPLVIIGKISYGLYLWHVPVFHIFKSYATFAPSVSFILKFAVTFLLAGLSWLLIEQRATALGRSISGRLMFKPKLSGNKL